MPKVNRIIMVEEDGVIISLDLDSIVTIIKPKGETKCKALIKGLGEPYYVTGFDYFKLNAAWIAYHNG